MTEFGVRKFATEGGYTVGWFRWDAATDAWTWSDPCTRSIDSSKSFGPCGHGRADG